MECITAPFLFIKANKTGKFTKIDQYQPLFDIFAASNPKFEWRQVADGKFFFFLSFFRCYNYFIIYIYTNSIIFSNFKVIIATYLIRQSLAIIYPILLASIVHNSMWKSIMSMRFFWSYPYSVLCNILLKINVFCQ